MSKKNVKRHIRKSGEIFPIIIAMLCVTAIILTAALVWSVNQSNRKDNVVVVMADQDRSESSKSFAESAGEDYALRLNDESYQTPLPTAEPTPAPEATPEPVDNLAASAEGVMETLDLQQGAPEQKSGFEYLPVIHKGDTTQKKIAITVDDCFQMNNLKVLSEYVYKNGGKLTVFPIGENVMRKGMPELLQKLVFEMGFEIENHTYSHARVFRLSEQEMAAEIWKQSIAVSYALGVDYDQHFFRLMGGDGEYDQRTHNYLKQLGFRGVADWSISGSDASLEQIKNALEPGAIYLFHTTDADMEKLKVFLPYALKQGYELVTLNELMGYEENKYAQPETNLLSRTLPLPEPYEVEYVDQKIGDYSWSVLRIQQRLMELGYLDKNAKSAVKGTAADGNYGASTSAAISEFQVDCGLLGSGVADAQTQERLFADDAPHKNQNNT